MATSPEEKKLRTVPFAAHATRGIIRDRSTRRKTILALLTVAVLMVIAGPTFLQEVLNPHEHFGRFAVYWLACGWLTFTAMLLALFDLLMLRAESRASRRALREQFQPSSDSTDDER
jgi:hypothetical protein